MKKILAYTEEEYETLNDMVSFLSQLESEIDSEHELNEDKEEIFDKAVDMIYEIISFFPKAEKIEVDEE